MQLSVSREQLHKSKADAVIIGVAQGAKPSDELKALDKCLSREISSLLESGRFSAEAGQAQAISTLGRIPAKRVVLAGLGEAAKVDCEGLRRAAGVGVLAAKAAGAKSAGTDLHYFETKGKLEERIQAVAEGATLADYQYTEQKTLGLDKTRKLERLELYAPQKDFLRAGNVLKRAEAVCNAISHARDLVNRPSGQKTPHALAEEALKTCRGLGVKCKVYDELELKQMGMNAILAVCSGSLEKPRLVVMDYNPNAKESIALVGKGVTFDSGGLNIKDFEGMRTMKQDMAGAAAVLGTIEAAAKIRLPVRIFGVLVLVENMPSGTAARSGDVAKAYNGKTIEIIHTDAEGRLILADALAFAEKNLKPNAIVDIATLTGAVRTALGRAFTGAMGNDAKLMQSVIAAGRESGEAVWELPLTPYFEDLMKSEVADVANIGKIRGEGGVITGAAFLKQFVEKIPWVHLDIGATAFYEERDSSKPYLGLGATGVGVRLFAALAQKLGKA